MNAPFEKPAQKSMKRKIALLLAVVMVLSMLPMNLFGAVTKTPSALEPGLDKDSTFNYTLKFDEADFAGFENTVTSTPSSVIVLFTLNGDHAHFTNTNLSTSLYDFKKANDSTMMLTLKPTATKNVSGVITPGATWSGNLTLTFNVKVVTGDGNVDIVMKTESNNRFIATNETGIVVGKTRNKTVSISAGDKIIGSDAFPINSIKVAENDANVLDVSYRIVFTPPDRFRWALTGNLGIGGGGPSRFDMKTDSLANHATDGYIIENGKIIVYLNRVINPGTRGNKDTLEFKNLRLVPNDNAPRSGELKMNVVVQEPVYKKDASGNNVTPLEIESWKNKWDGTDLLVAERAVAGLTLTAGDAKTFWSGTNGNETNYITLKESSPGSWQAPAETLFTVPDGVIITKVQVRGNNLKDFPATDKDPSTSEGYGTRDSKGILLRQNSVSVRPDKNNVEKISELQIRFILSIEPGYETKYGASVPITISGRGVDAIEGQEVMIANIRDPFTVEMFDIKDNSTSNNVDIVIGELRITEAEAGKFGEGSELWLYAVDSNGREDFTLSIASSRDVSTDGGSWLRASRSGSYMTPNATTNRNALVISIDNRSWDTGGTIIIKDIMIGGNLRAGSTLKLAISGDLASNNAYVAFEKQREDKDAKTLSGVIREVAGIFDTVPFIYAIAETTTPGDEEPGDVEPGDVDPGEEPWGPEKPGGLVNEAIMNSFSFSENDSYDGNGDKIFVLEFGNPGDTAKTSYIMATALFDLLGFETGWDPITATASWTGYNAYNQLISIQIVGAGSTVFYVSTNGGTYVPHTFTASVGVVPALNLFDRTFVPLKAFEEVLGIVIQWNAATSSVTVNP